MIDNFCILNPYRCILEETQSCQIDVRAAYAQAVKAEQLVIRDLCRPGLFQDGKYMLLVQLLATTTLAANNRKPLVT